MGLREKINSALIRDYGALILLGFQKNESQISTHLLTVTVDFCLTLSNAVEPVNNGFYGTCCFCQMVSDFVKNF